MELDNATERFELPITFVTVGPGAQTRPAEVSPVVNDTGLIRLLSGGDPLDSLSLTSTRSRTSRCLAVVPATSHRLRGWPLLR